VDRESGLRHVHEGIATTRAVLAAEDLGTPVVSCPGWTLHDLGAHLAQIHRWVVGGITHGHPDTVVPAAPGDRDGLLAWYDDGAAVLVGLLEGRDPGSECWTFHPADRTVGFWIRRQAHEHAVHAVDATRTVGAETPLDQGLALDGVDEVVRVFFPRQVRLGRIAPLTRTLALAPDGGPASVLAGDGTQPVDAAAAQATVGGPADVLYLLLWGRAGLDDPRLTVTGDPEAARSVLGTRLVP